MPLYTRKRLILLFFLSLFLVFSPAASAQNKDRNQDLSIATQPKTPSNEPETASGKLRVDGDLQDSDDLPKFIQTSGFGGKMDSEVKGADETADDRSERFGEFSKASINDFTHHFRSSDDRERKNKFNYLPTDGDEKSSLRPNWAIADLSDDTKDASSPEEGFQWRSAIQQSLIFLAVQHGYALTQPKTREALKGKFFKDYAKSVKSLRGWDDGGRFFTNYIAHPLQGAFTGFIYVQNDPKAKKQQFGASGDYWRGRLKALAWTAAWSTQFEIGPISQASIGNVGLKNKQTWEDIVVTPTLGTAMLVAEDAADRFIMRRIERKTNNFYVKIFSRMLLSPARVFANMLRFKAPWYRDRPTEH